MTKSTSTFQHSIIYKQELTYPENPELKERTSLIEDPRPTEKEFSTFQHNKYSEIFLVL